MKRFIAIALLSLHLFSIGGHVLLYQYFAYRSDQFFNEQIGKGFYNRNDLVEIKIPVDMPNVKSWDVYESIRGQVQFKSACYNYVKMKLTHDAIYLMCVPNYEKTRLLDQNIINVKNMADIPVNKKSHVPFGKINNPDKYNYPITLYKLPAPVVIVHLNNHNYYSCLADREAEVPEQPPKLLC